MIKSDEYYIKRAIDIAQKARDKGDEPFGALLVNKKGDILFEGENTIVTEKDCTGHAELNVMRMASKKYDEEYLKKCTIYASTEPCAMCCGAIFWGNVRRIVFGLSGSSLYQMVEKDSEEVLNINSRDFFKKGHKSVEIVGPLLEELAKNVHKDFWL